jgi:steroid delta-isomerase-like uncharacterized protein
MGWVVSDWLRGYLDAWSSHDGGRVAEFMADDVVHEDVALEQVHRGRDAVKAFVAEGDAASSNFKIELVSSHLAPDRYAFDWLMSGTNDGEGAGLPATGKEYSIRGVSYGRLDATAKVVENRDYWNLAAYLTQVGILPAPGP